MFSTYSAVCADCACAAITPPANGLITNTVAVFAASDTQYITCVDPILLLYGQGDGGTATATCTLSDDGNSAIIQSERSVHRHAVIPLFRLSQQSF